MTMIPQPYNLQDNRSLVDCNAVRWIECGWTCSHLFEVLMSGHLFIKKRRNGDV